MYPYDWFSARTHLIRSYIPQSHKVSGPYKQTRIKSPKKHVIIIIIVREILWSESDGTKVERFGTETHADQPKSASPED